MRDLYERFVWEGIRPNDHGTDLYGEFEWEFKGARDLYREFVWEGDRSYHKGSVREG